MKSGRTTRALICLAAAALAAFGLAACGGGSDESGPPRPHLLRRDPARRDDRGSLETVLGRIGRQVHDHAGIPPHRRQPAARTAGPPARRRGLLDRHRRHGRDLDRRVRQRRLGRRVDRAAEEAGHRKGLPQRDRDRLLRGQALRGAVQHQHPAALVPQRPGQEAAEDLGRDDRRGRRAERSRHDPGPGQPLRGLHGLRQRADRERRHRNPLRPRRSRPRTGADRKGAGGDRQAGQRRRRAAEPLDLRRGHRPARLRGRRIGLHDQLHLRLRQRPGRSAGNRQEHGLRPLPAGRREQAEQAAARRLQPRGQLLLRATRTSPSKRPPAWPTTRARKPRSNSTACRRRAPTSTPTKP